MTRYVAVDSLKTEFAVAALCQAVAVSTSAYYEWGAGVSSDPTEAETPEATLLAEIKEIHRSSGGPYGSPRVTSELRDRGWCVNHKRVERLMADHDIVGFSGRKESAPPSPPKATPRSAIWWDVTSNRENRTTPGVVTSATSPPAKAGFISSQSSISPPRHVSECPWPTTCAPASSGRR